MMGLKSQDSRHLCPIDHEVVFHVTNLLCESEQDTFFPWVTSLHYSGLLQFLCIEESQWRFSRKPASLSLGTLPTTSLHMNSLLAARAALRLI